MSAVGAKVFLAMCVVFVWAGTILLGGGAVYYTWKWLRDPGGDAGDAAGVAWLFFVIFGAAGAGLCAFIDDEDSQP